MRLPYLAVRVILGGKMWVMQQRRNKQNELYFSNLLLVDVNRVRVDCDAISPWWGGGWVVKR